MMDGPPSRAPWVLLWAVVWWSNTFPDKDVLYLDSERDQKLSGFRVESFNDPF